MSLSHFITGIEEEMSFRKAECPHASIYSSLSCGEIELDTSKVTNNGQER
jgi:hypothetical protein